MFKPSESGYCVCWDTVDNNQCDTAWWPNGGGTTRVLQDLAPATYYWQVRTAGSQEQANGGAWWPFTVGTPVVSFSKQTPGAGAILTANAATLVWGAREGLLMTISWCCTAFMGCAMDAGERGFGIVACRDSNRSPLFLLQHRSLEAGDAGPVKYEGPITTISEIGIRFCPWCGATLADAYGDQIDALCRQDLVLGQL